MCILSPVQLFATPQTVAARLLHPWDFPGENTGVGCHFLLQGDLPNPGLKPLSPESPALQADSLLLSHWGSPTMYSIYMYTCVCVYLYLVYVCIYIIYSICVCMFYVYIIYENMSTVAQRKFPRFVN